MALSFVQLKLRAEDLAEADFVLQGIKNGALKARTNAINATITELKKLMVYEFTRLSTIKKKNLKKRIFSRRFDPQKGTASLTLYGRNLGLINFNAKDTRPKSRKLYTRKKRRSGRRGKGVTFEVIRGQKQTLPHAFIAAGKNENTHVFQRRNLGLNKSLPIDAMKSMKLFDLFQMTGIKNTIEAKANTILSDIFRQKVADQIQKASAKNVNANQ